MLVSMASFPNTFVLSCIFFVLMFWMSRRAHGTNILLTGQTLGPNEQLSYEDNGVRLVMRFDCFLKLQDGFGRSIWSSTMRCYGCSNCSLSLTDRGQLVIRAPEGHIRWTSPYIKNSRVGKYVGILHPAGEFAIYGPGIWYVGPGVKSVKFNNSEKVSSQNNLKNDPTIYNVLLPKEELYDGEKLCSISGYGSDKLYASSGYELALKDCELILTTHGETRWYSNTHIDGAKCFAKVDYKGVLAIKNSDNKLIWSSYASGKEGDYVLVLQKNGNVVIYGPKVWSTKDSKSGFIKMAAFEK